MATRPFDARVRGHEESEAGQGVVKAGGRDPAPGLFGAASNVG